MGGERFTVLDSWRGIAASMVALFHLRAYSHVADLGLVQNAYLFVDFFFVLSGFIIAATYEQRLASGFSVWRFMLLRFGRVYPLHFAMVLAFVLLGNSALSAPGGWDAMLVHLLLLHGLGVIDVGAWGNVPSWSISTEFFAYAAFAIAVTTLGRNTRWALIAVLLAFPVLLYFTKGNITANGYQVIRGLYGFAAGAIAWHLFRYLRERAPAGTRAEAAAIAALAYFVSTAGEGPWSIAAPFVFAAVVLVFASQAGAASRLLARKPFVFLGTVSYSIYMVHFFIAHRALDAVTLAKSLGMSAADSLGRDKWTGDLAILLYLIFVIAASAITYRFVEVPARDWFRRMAQRSAHPVERPA